MTWKRPELTARAPNRAIGGLYRIAPGQKGGKIFGGVPLQTTEDAVVAAVRTGYRIADAQIEHGMRIAQELRGAAQRAGAGEPKDMLTNAEALIGRALQLMAEWLETLAAEPSSPLKRLLSAQYRLLGALIGLEANAPKDFVAEIQELVKQTVRDAAAPERSARPERRPPVARPVIKFDKEPRAVELVKWELSNDLANVQLSPLNFMRAGDPGSTFNGSIERRPNGMLTLALSLDAKTPEGQWKAPICGTDKVLLGVAVVEL